MNILEIFKNGYGFDSFKKDFLASVAVLILIIPQGLAYGLLAGFTPESGLYAGIISLLIYPLFATSLQLSVGPVALISIILLTGLTGLAEPFTPDFIRLGLFVGLMSGVFQVLFSVLRLGFIVNFLSNPVISGFISASAVIICINQLNVLLGISMIKSNNAIQDFYTIIRSLGQVHLISAIMGVVTIILIVVLKKINKKIPSVLIVFFLGTLVTYFFGLAPKGVKIINELNTGLPSFKIFYVSFAEFKSLITLSLIIALISFIESSAIARKLASNSPNNRIKPNQELLGLGFSKILGSFFQAIPSSGSFGRSALNATMGSKTPFSSIFTGLLLLIVLLFLTPLFYYTPKTVLAAIIISAVANLIDFKIFKSLYKLDRADFFALLACFFITLIVGIQEGLLSGVLISLGFILWKTMRPHYAVLGEMTDKNIYRNVKRFDNLYINEQILIFRFDDDLYFANGDFFYDSLLRKIEQKGDKLKYLIIDMSSVSHIDSSGFDTFKLLKHKLDSLEIQLKLASIKGPVRDLMLSRNFEKTIPLSSTYWSIQDAAASCNLS